MNHPYTDGADGLGSNVVRGVPQEPAVRITSTASPPVFMDAAEEAAWRYKALTPFQKRVHDWMLACFGKEISGDRTERNHRFLEEALELAQSLECTASEAHQLVDYVFGRPVGDTFQEVGGVAVTLAALCNAADIDGALAAETELVRVWGKVEAIRAKQAGKPKHGPLAEAKGFNIVATDNLARDYNGGRSEWLIAGNIRSKEQADALASAWNSQFSGDLAGDWAVVRDASEPLYEFTGY